MKITDLKCAIIANSPVIRITTDEGITGWSQIETPKPYVKPQVLQLKDWIVGQDPRDVERVMRRIRVRGGFKPFGSAVSAIEHALWDIAGKALNAPVYRLLGGKVRDQVRTYRTLYQAEVPGGAEHTPEGYKRWAEYGKSLKGEFTLFKLPSAFHSSMVRDFPNYFYGEVQHDAPFPYPHKGTMTKEGLDHLVACITSARETLGKGYNTAVDAGPGFMPLDALRLAKAVEHLHLMWIEDTVTGDYSPYVNPDVYKDVTHHTTTPIHTGEQIYLRQHYKALIESHAVNVIGPDPCDVGGLAEIKWVAEHADLHGIAIAPHGTANGILGLAALIQVCATMPDNLIAFEYPARFEPFWYDITEGFEGMPVKGGLIDVPDRPGLGVNLIAKEAKKYLEEGDENFFD
ncbi:mandelate racemase/muconate lactonizing enzyme family protein [Devosia sp. CN2-171]|uniref:mandelate racemase/muconate lactonizing enzyme family protein n=1 Tax=Devosia sp. CN2-171 TaxID=3400909 RepID=UPI003BF91D63